MGIFEEVSKKVNEVFDEKNLDDLARKSGALKRRRIITPKSLLENMLFLRLKNPTHSLDDLALEFKQRGCSVSKIALRKKLLKSAFFFQLILEALFSQIFTTNMVFKAISFIRSVKVIDSTEVALSKKLKNEYPGTRNRSSTAKLQVLIDVVSTQILSLSTHKSTETDQGYRGHIEHIRNGDLLISDLGYFCIDTFKKIAIKGGYFLSRLFKNAKIYDINTSKEINLRSKLSKTTKTKLDMDINLGKIKLPCRLVAIKLDEESYQKRLKNLAEKRRKDHRMKENINDVLNGWTIFITNLPISVMPRSLLLLYSARWQIELVFKAIKTFFCLRKIEKTNKAYVHILLYISMIAVTLLTLCILTIKNKEISLYKACRIFAKNINKFIEYLNDKSKCSISWMVGLLEEFALKETRTNRRSTKKLLGLKPLNP